MPAVPAAIPACCKGCKLTRSSFPNVTRAAAGAIAGPRAVDDSLQPACRWRETTPVDRCGDFVPRPQTKL